MRFLKLALYSFVLFVSSISIAFSADWSSTTEKQSKVYFSLDVSKEYAATGWNASYTQRRYRIFIRDRKTSDPRAEIYYDELGPKRFYQFVRSAKDQVQNFGYFKKGFTFVSEQKTHGNDKFEYIVVDKGQRQCVVFVLRSGDGAGDGQISAGTAALYGYYCNPIAQDFQQTSIEKVLDAVGTKQAGSLGS